MGRIGARLARTLSWIGEHRDLRLLIDAARLSWSLPRRLDREPLLALLEELGARPVRVAAAQRPALDRAGLAARVREATELVEPFGRGARSGRCLRLTVVRWVLLKERGIPVELAFGFDERAAPTRGVAGHAWLTLEGGAYLEDDDPERTHAVLLRSGSPTGSPSTASEPA